MTPHTRPGRIEVVAGVMFSGKSEELIRRVRRALIAHHRVRVFKSHLDERYAGLYRVSSHTGASVDAEPIDRAEEILRAVGETDGIDVAAVDEAQFLDAGIVEVATHLAERGVRVILAGTDTDFRGEPFGMMGHLMAIAEDVVKLQAICVVCGDLACRNQRLVDGEPAPWDSPVVMVGGGETYEARCRRCFRIPRLSEDQVPLL
ncbi:MAG: thymidine kinase [Gemmatimonadales bacterium]